MVKRLKKCVTPEEREEIERQESFAAKERDKLLEKYYLETWPKESVMEKFYGEKNKEKEPALEFDLKNILQDLIKHGIKKTNLLIPGSVIDIFLDIGCELPQVKKKLKKYGKKLTPDFIRNNPDIVTDVVRELEKDGKIDLGDVVGMAVGRIKN